MSVVILAGVSIFDTFYNLLGLLLVYPIYSIVTCCRNLLTQLLLHFYIVIAVPALEMPRVTPLYTSVEVTVSKPSGLCGGLRSSQITYEFKMYRSNSSVTTESVTTSGPNATATLSGLNNTTEYRVEIRGVINVISQSMPVSVAFMTLGGMYICVDVCGMLCGQIK